MLDYKLDYLFSYSAQLSFPPESIGEVPGGVRAHFYVRGGKVVGPRLNGKLLPVGGDWLIVRRDGIGEIDVRITIETDTGALVYSNYTGIIDLGENGYQKFINQDLPEAIPLRIVPRYQTGHSDYLWLNRIQGLGVGRITTHDFVVNYDIYEIK